MKKIFLAIAVIAGGSASAQQKTIPVFPQKYPSILQKKQSFPRYNILQKTIKPAPGKNIPVSGGQTMQTIPLPGLANGNKLAVLPPGSMPCIVPDMSVYRMPVAGNSIPENPSAPGAIPNAADNNRSK